MHTYIHMIRWLLTVIPDLLQEMWGRSKGIFLEAHSSAAQWEQETRRFQQMEGENRLLKAVLLSFDLLMSAVSLRCSHACTGTHHREMGWEKMMVVTMVMMMMMIKLKQ